MHSRHLLARFVVSLVLFSSRSAMMGIEPLQSCFSVEGTP